MYNTLYQWKVEIRIEREKKNSFNDRFATVFCNRLRDIVQDKTWTTNLN